MGLRSIVTVNCPARKAQIMCRPTQESSSTRTEHSGADPNTLRTIQHSANIRDQQFLRLGHTVDVLELTTRTWLPFTFSPPFFPTIQYMPRVSMFIDHIARQHDNSRTLGTSTNTFGG
jgi:hypothetical protein